MLPQASHRKNLNINNKAKLEISVSPQWDRAWSVKPCHEFPEDSLLSNSEVSVATPALEDIRDRPPSWRLLDRTGTGGPGWHPLHAGDSALPPGLGSTSAPSASTPWWFATGSAASLARGRPYCELWVPVLGQAAWQGGKRRFRYKPFLGAQTSHWHSTWSISRWLPWHQVHQVHQTQKVSQKCRGHVHPLGLAECRKSTVILICGTWILKPHSLRSFLLCPRSAGFPDVCSQQLSAASP